MSERFKRRLGTWRAGTKSRVAALAIALIIFVPACTTAPPPAVVDDDEPAAEYPYGNESRLTDAPSEVPVGSVGSVVVPGAAPGTTTNVAVATRADFVDVAVRVPKVTPVIAVVLTGDLALTGEDAGLPPILQLNFRPSASPSGASVAPSALANAMTVIRVRETSATGTGPWVDLAGAAEWNDATAEYSTSIVDPKSVCDALTGSTAAAAISCEYTGQVVDIGPTLKERIDNVLHGQIHQRIGMHQADPVGFVAAGADCEAPGPWSWLVHDSQSSSWQQDHRTAVVFVHGYQTLSGILGDTRANAAHCNVFRSFLEAIGSSSGPWAEIRGNADVFLFRYESDRRVASNSELLADWFEGLRDLDYERIVLVGHSMGGLVIHDARQIDAARDLAPEPSDSRVITLATPYMGSVLLCKDWNAEVCTAAKASIVPLSQGVVVSRLPSASTLDLSTAHEIPLPTRTLMGHFTQIGDVLVPLTFTPNPYLKELWERVDLSDPSITAFIGSNGVAPSVFENAEYAFSSERLAALWGNNDGIVPISSGVAAIRLARSNPIARLADTRFYGRDHGQMNAGCTTGTGCPTTGLFGDTYLDDVAATIAAALLPSTNAITGTIASLPAGKWRATILFPSLLSGYTSFGAVGSSAPIAASGDFSLDLGAITPPPVPLTTPSTPTGAVLDPPATLGATFSLIAFDDANGNRTLDAGEVLYEINDPANTFGTGALVLEYADRAFTILGNGQTSAGTPIKWNVTSDGDWGRTIYKTVTAGPQVEVTFSHELVGLSLTPGRRGAIGTAAFGAGTNELTRGLFEGE